MGKRPQPGLRDDALTGEWQNGEAGEGRGSEPCDPGGLRHQAGGASWRAPRQDPVKRISPGPTRWPPGAERRLVPAKSNLKPQTSTAERKARALRYEDRCVLLLELALEKESDQHLNNYRPGGGGSGSQGKGYQGSRPGQGTTPKQARVMENVKKLFWCDARDEQRHLQHAPDCEKRDCFVVQEKKQETNTGAKAKLPDHYRCTITCAFCRKRKHYEDECYHKQRLSAKLKGEDPGKGSGKGGGKGKGNDYGKGKSKGLGQGQDKGQGGRGGGANRQPDKDNKKPDKNGGNPTPNPGGNSEPSGGQSGPTTRSQTQAQREQGAKREHEGGDDGNPKKRSRFMRMASKLRNKGFEMTCPAEF